MKVGIIGSGEVGQTLGSAFISEGNEVMLGSRTPTKKEIADWKKENAKAQTGTFSDAAKFGELIVLAVAGLVAEDVVKSAGIENLKGKIVVDATNPLGHEAPVNGVLKSFVDLNDSLMERLQKIAPDAKFVKAFNTIGSSLMYKPNLSGGKPSMFICGNDDQAKLVVSKILTDFGFEIEDMGKAEGARAIEPLAVLWCIPGFLRNDWTHAFKVLR